MPIWLPRPDSEASCSGCELPFIRGEEHQGAEHRPLGGERDLDGGPPARGLERGQRITGNQDVERQSLGLPAGLAEAALQHLRDAKREGGRDVGRQVHGRHQPQPGVSAVAIRKDERDPRDEAELRDDLAESVLEDALEIERLTDHGSYGVEGSELLRASGHTPVELRVRLPQLRGHLVELLPELLQLVVRRDADCVLEVTRRHLSSRLREVEHRAREAAHAEQHHQGWDQHPEHEEDQEEGAVPLGWLNEGRPVLHGDQAPRGPRHRGVAGHHVPAVEVLGTLGTGLARHDAPDHPLRREVGPDQRRIGVRDHATVAVDQVDVAAHPYAKLGDVAVQAR